MKHIGVLFLVLFLSVQLALWPAFSYAGCPACDAFQAERNSCQKKEPDPAPSGTPASPTPEPTTSKSGRACSDVMTQWHQVSSHCDAYEMNSDTKDKGQVAAIAFTATAGVCAAACASSAIGAGACAAAGVGASVIDIGIQISLMIEGQFFENWVGGVASAAGAYAAREAVTQNAANNLDPCKAALYFGIIAALKYYNMNSNSENAQKECAAATSYLSSSAYASIGGSQSGGASLPDSSSSGSSLSNSPSSPYSSVTNGVPDNNDNFPNGYFSAATAAPFGKAFEQMPNANKIPQALEALGSSLKDLSKKLEKQSPGATVGELLSGAPESLKQAFLDIDKAAKEGKITYRLDGVSSTNPDQASAYKGGGRGGKSAAANPLSGLTSFGSSGGTLTAGPQQTDFAKQQKIAPSLTGEDIWHTDWKGSIFQIVSTKITQNRDRVDALEWQTPLNRALTGLSNTSNKERKSK